MLLKINCRENTLLNYSKGNWELSFCFIIANVSIVLKIFVILENYIQSYISLPIQVFYDLRTQIFQGTLNMNSLHCTWSDCINVFGSFTFETLTFDDIIISRPNKNLEYKLQEQSWKVSNHLSHYLELSGTLELASNFSQFPNNLPGIGLMGGIGSSYYFKKVNQLFVCYQSKFENLDAFLHFSKLLRFY